MFERCCLDIFNWNWIISKLCYFNIKSRYLKIMLFKHSEQIFPENMLFTWVQPDISRQKHVFEWYFGDILQYILKISIKCFCATWVCIRSNKSKKPFIAYISSLNVSVLLMRRLLWHTWNLVSLICAFSTRITPF